MATKSRKQQPIGDDARAQRVQRTQRKQRVAEVRERELVLDYDERPTPYSVSNWPFRLGNIGF